MMVYISNHTVNVTQSPSLNILLQILTTTTTSKKYIITIVCFSRSIKQQGKIPDVKGQGTECDPDIQC